MNPLESQWSCFMWIQRDALPGQESTQGRKIVQSGTSAKSLWRGGKRALDIWTVRHGVSETGSHRSIPFPPTWSFLLQFCVAIVAGGKISPIPNESLLTYLQSSDPYGCFMYMFSKLVTLSGCGMGQLCSYHHYTSIAATIKMCPALKFSEQREMD